MDKEGRKRIYLAQHQPFFNSELDFGGELFLILSVIRVSNHYVIQVTEM